MDDKEYIERAATEGCAGVSPWHVREALRLLLARIEALEDAERVRALNSPESE